MNLLVDMCNQALTHFNLFIYVLLYSADFLLVIIPYHHLLQTNNDLTVGDIESFMNFTWSRRLFGS